MRFEPEWVDARSLTVDGRGWSDPANPWARLPASAKGVVRDAVWDLSRHSAGIAVRLRTTGGPLAVRWTLGSESLEMPHMPATGVSGIDVYTRDSKGVWRFVDNLPPKKRQSQGSVNLPRNRPQEVMLYLPLYNAALSVEVACPGGPPPIPAPPRPGGNDRPWVVYGTSIAQGGCASRPGMAWPTILARRIDRPAINLGFSGNGKLDPEMGPLLAELDPVAYVIDCLHNCGSLGRPEIEQRVAGLVNAIRARRTAPIVFVGKSAIDDRVAADQRSIWQEAAVERVRAGGVRDVHVVSGKVLNGGDGDATVDGVHPNDLGMLRHAEALEPVIRRLASGGGR